MRYFFTEQSVRVDRPEEQPEQIVEGEEPYGGTEASASPRGRIMQIGSNDDVLWMENPMDDE